MAKLLITGANGLVGSALRRLLENSFLECYFVDRKVCDLRKSEDVDLIFFKVRPDYVIHAAARVGGIGRNLNSPYQQYYDNIMMNTNVIDAARKTAVKKLIAFSSVCAYPSDASVLTEDNLHDGKPFPAHWSYAHSKRMVDVQIGAMYDEFGVKYCSILPGNIFGENDNFNLEDGHVVPSLIRKCFEAKEEGKPLEVWGTGEPYREFIYVEDLAKVCIDLLVRYEDLPRRLIVSGVELQIRDLVKMVCSAVGYDNVVYKTDKPNGQMRRPTHSKLFRELFPEFEHTNIARSIKKTCDWYKLANNKRL